MSLEFECPSCGERFAVDLDAVGSEKACLHCGAAATLPGYPLNEGFFLGDFAMIGPLGAGRDGAVYLAEDAKTGKLVALRVPADELTGGGENAETFFEQVALLQTFDPPHLARIISTGQIGDLCFYVMEYCGGGSLAMRLQKGRLEEAEALRILEQLAEALAYLHQQKYIPRDLTPS